MTRVLFVIPPPLPDLVANHEATAGIGSLGPGKNGFAYPPHLIAYCVASVREKGWQATVADGTHAFMGPLVEADEVFSHDILAVQVGAGTWLSDVTYLRILRQHVRARVSSQSLPSILLFGPSAAQVGRAALEEGLAAAVLVGEPELAIAKALHAVLDGRPGLLRAAELAPADYAPSGLIANLDRLPIPAWDAVTWQPYGMVTLLSSRGCGAGCRYCAYTLSQGIVTRTQTVARTLAEWRAIAETVRPPRLIVRDTVFAQDRGRVVALCEGILAEGLNAPWECESRPEHFDRGLLALLKRAGCAAIKIGLESGDPALLAQLGRVSSEAAAGEYLAQVRRVARWCAEIDLHCRVFVLAGLPGQSARSVEMTRAALTALPRTVTINPSVYRAYPGVGLEGRAQAVAPAALDSLRTANLAPPLYRRALRRAKRALKRTLALPIHAPKSRIEQAPQAMPTVASREKVTGQRLLARQYLLAGSRVFLTGGNGFVGGYVARALADAGAQVVALVRPNSDPGPLVEIPGVEIVRGDLAQPTAWVTALSGCRFCFHVAALYAGPDRAEEMLAVNAHATGTLLAACAEAGVARFIHTSTVGTVGRPATPGALPDETTRFNLWDQASPYVRSKYLGELVARCWHGLGLDVVIVKPTAPVGAGDARPTATGKRILAALRGEMTGYPPGGVNHAPVTDIATGHLLAAERGRAGETYILGHCDGNLDQAGFLARVAKAAAAVGCERTVAQGPQRASSGLLDSLAVAPWRAVDELGMPQSDLDAAFRESARWYCTHTPGAPLKEPSAEAEASRVRIS